METGWHTRTSFLTLFDGEKGYCETLNSVYLLEGENGNDIFTDLGNGVFGIFY